MNTPITQKQPIHIKIISAFYYLVAMFFAISGFTYIFVPRLIKNLFLDNVYMQSMSTGQLIFWGFVLLIIAGMETLLAYKIYKNSKVAKIMAIVISAVGLVWSIFGLVYYQGIENIFFLIIHSYFLWALKHK